MSIPTPAEIKTHLDKYVVGQERAKRTLSVAVSNHYRMAAYGGDTRISKSNILILGPTGSGKTFMVQTIARFLNVPFSAISATAITPPGWAGADPEQCIKDLALASRRLNPENKIDWAAARHGIVYIDEVDKLAQQKQESSQVSSGFTQIGIQQSLLKMVEGEMVIISGNPLPTDQILFIASGAFVGLERYISLRELKGRLPMKSRPDPTTFRRVIPQDLIQFGLIPEFVGRFPVVTALDPLTIDDLVHVLRDVEDSLLKQVRARASVTGSAIEVDEVVIRRWAQMAIEQGVGARGLRTMVEKFLEPVWEQIRPEETMRFTAEGIVRGGVLSETPFEVLDFSSEPSAAAPQEGMI